MFVNELITQDNLASDKETTAREKKPNASVLATAMHKSPKRSSPAMQANPLELEIPS